MSELCPYKWTTITALGILLFLLASIKAFSKAIGDIFQLSGSESINTGIPFSYIIGLQLAANVKLEQKTTSPSFIPIHFNAKCIADVPETNAAEDFTPT